MILEAVKAKREEEAQKELMSSQVCSDTEMYKYCTCTYIHTYTWTCMYVRTYVHARAVAHSLASQAMAGLI